MRGIDKRAGKKGAIGLYSSALKVSVAGAGIDLCADACGRGVGQPYGHSCPHNTPGRPSALCAPWKLEPSGRVWTCPGALVKDQRLPQHDEESSRPHNTPRRRAGGHVCRGQLRHDERERLGERLCGLGTLRCRTLLRRRRAPFVPRRHLRCIGEGDVINVHGYM